MTTTTSKLGADMTDDEIKSLAKQHYAMYDHWQIDLVAFARALLARQPAAIDKDAVRAKVIDKMLAEVDNLLCDRMKADPHGTLDKALETARNVRLMLAEAAPLDKEAGKLAAPSVEQDERGAVIATVRTDPPITGVTTGPWTRLFVADVEIDRSGDPTELVKKAEQINHSYAHQSRAASTSANVAQGAELVHLDDWWVDLFAKEMKAKLENARAKGRGGWQDCDPADLSRMLGEHVEKGDPRDVANFCMFLWALRSPICADPPAQTALADAQKWEIAERVHAQCERLKPHATFRSAASQAINDTLDALTAAQSASGDK